MHSLVRTFAFLVGTTGIAAIVACSGSDGAPDSNGGATELPSSTATTTATSTSPTQPAPTTQSSTTTSKDGGVHEGGTPSPTGTGGALGSTCTKPSDCQSGVCYVGGQASYCSLSCTQQNAAQVCAPPVFNGVCNKQGFCRLP